MELTAEKLIDLLYFCEESGEIQDLEKELNIHRPIINKEFKEDGYIAIESTSTKTEVFFSDIIKFNKNIDEGQTCNMILSGVSFYYKTKIPLPFSLQMDDNLDVVIQKIGKNPDYESKNFPRKMWVLQRNDGKDYILYANFDEPDYEELINISIQTYDDTINLLNNEFHIKNN